MIYDEFRYWNVAKILIPERLISVYPLFFKFSCLIHKKHFININLNSFFLEPYNTYKFYNFLLYIILYLIAEYNILFIISTALLGGTASLDILGLLMGSAMYFLPFYILTFSSKIVSILIIYKIIM